MKFDTVTITPQLHDMPAHARAAEALGFDGIWTAETQHNPFLPLALAAEHTRNVNLGTAIAVAFPRSPTVLAQIAWDLAEQSDGRFILGLGTQVKAHIERRFGMTWESPTPKLREMILAIRALWDAWQGDGRVNYRGEFYKITLMTPFFNPGPIEHPRIPIWIAGVNDHLIRLAGELCEGFHVHSFHTPAYLRDVIVPNIEAGAQKSGRTRKDVTLFCALFVATNDAEREVMRTQVAFYASTPTYHSVFEHHGWKEQAEKLSALAARAKWDEMPAVVTDEMLNEFVMIGEPKDIPDMVSARYKGWLDRCAFYMPYTPGDDDARWKMWIEAIHAI